MSSHSLEASLSLGPRVARPGLSLRSADGSPFKDHEGELLEAKLEARIGEDMVKKIDFSVDRLQAYVELHDEAAIGKVLSCGLNLAKNKPPLLIERFDLMEVWRPYLIARGLEEWITEDMIVEHFQAEAGGTQVELVEVLENGRVANVSFIDPQAALGFEASTELLGMTVELEVAYSSPAQKKEMVLAVKQLPLNKIPERNMKSALVRHITKHTGHTAADCRIKNGIGYLSFNDPSAVSAILQSPPSKPFFAGVTLELSAAPMTDMVEPGEEESSALQRTYSSASESSSVTPNSSYGSMQMKQAFSREFSKESSSSFNDFSDPESSINLKPQDSFGSTDSGLVFSPPGNPPPGGFPIRKDRYFSSSSSLGRVPEHAPIGATKCDDMSVQDLEGLGDSSISSYDHPSKVLVQDVPVQKRDCTLLKYYLYSLTRVQCEVKQFQGGKSFLATFQQPINFQLLKEKGRESPLDDTYQLTFCHMLDSKNRKILVTFCSQDEQLMNEYVVKLHFEFIAGKGSIEKIDFLPPDQVCVIFKDAQSVKKVTSNPNSQVLADTSVCIEEYYDFMVEETDSQQPPQQEVTPPPAPDPTFDWHPTQHPVEELQANWLRRNLQKLSNELSTINALAKLSSNQSGSSSSVEILPLSGAEKMSDWENLVKSTFETFFSCYKAHSQAVPQYCREVILQYAKSQDCPSLIVRLDNDALTLAGDGRAVDEVSVSINDMIRNFVQVEEKNFPLKHIKYLQQFCTPKLNNLPVQQELDYNLRVIHIEGNEESRKEFWDMVAAEIAKMQEKSLTLTPEGFKLLSSQRGAAKIQGIIGAHQICFVMEDCKVCLFSPNKDAPLKEVKESLKMCTHSHEHPVQDPIKFRFCSDIKWKQLVNELQNDVFVLVTVNDTTKSVTVTGEKIVVDSVVQRIVLFLAEQTCVQEQVKIPSHKWIVISKSFDTKMNNINHSVQGKDVKITWPSRGERSNVTVVIKGEPAEVDRVKGEIEALCSKVCEREVKLCNIPAAIQVVESMEDKIRLIENNFGAAIDVSLMSDDLNSPTTSAQPTCTPVCTATCPNEVRVSVYTGNFTKHNHVDAIVNFVPPNPDFQEENLKQLFVAGGIRDDFKSKIAQFLQHSLGDLFNSDHGKLLCGQLLHCFVPPWISGHSSETFYLEMALTKILSKLERCDRILLTSLCSSPLKYPPAVFAGSVISLISSNPNVASRGQLTVAVYVDTLAQAREFEKQLQLNNCRITAQVPSHQPTLTTPTTPTTTATTTLAGPISSFLTLTQGSLLQQQAEVYINSTNRNMELNTGTLSKEFLKACGDELQKKCNDYIPLKEEDVVITEVKNLKADSIYHVALPDYNSDHNAKKKFRKTVQVILRTARDKSVKSLAFPSLGVGNLHYPAQVSANILFEEIIAFQAKNRGSNIQYHCVVYDQGTYKEFSKEYAKRMNTAPPPKKVLKGGKKGSGSTLLSVVKSDISEEQTDVIVNTTTEEMKLNESAVSKAILRKAGPSLQQACDLLVQSGLKLDHGQITDTRSFGSLQCKRIIHAHLPPRSEATRSGVNHYSLIVEIVTKCLEKAESLDMKSISFPAFGFGQGGYSVDQVAEPMLTAFRDFGRQSPKSVEIIRVVIFDSALHQQFFEFFVNFFKVDVSTPLKIVSSIYKTLNPWSGHGERSVELQDGSVATTRSLGYSYQEPPASQLLVFKIFAGTSDQCDQIAAKLKENIKEKYENNPVEKPILANLIDADIEELKSIGAKHQVEVKVLPQIMKLEILGEKGHVRDAKFEIMQVINDIEKAENELKLFQWQSENSSSDIETYSKEDSFKLERAKAKSLPVIEMAIDGINVVIDLVRMEERNKDTGDVRKVMRVAIKSSLELPKTWEPQPVDSKAELFEVAQGSAEYQEALKRFNDTISQTVTIVSLKRIQNPVEYHRHIAVKDNIAKKYRKKPEVRQLFHGSREGSIKAITVQGFNRNYAGANAAFYGHGVYFAVNASYSAQPKYSVPNKQGHQSMFICQVVIGKYTLGKKGMKVAAQENLETYETLVENMSNPTIFVAMTDAQAYPEYLLTFKVEKTGKN